MGGGGGGGGPQGRGGRAERAERLADGVLFRSGHARAEQGLQRLDLILFAGGEGTRAGIRIGLDSSLRLRFLADLAENALQPLLLNDGDSFLTDLVAENSEDLGLASVHREVLSWSEGMTSSSPSSSSEKTGSFRENW
jgi:hypothetical protein